ncbi:Rsp5p-dependent ubiquitination, sorting of cargo proteins at the multivesicular body [Blyttiomyces sp. JEL0837]|nr:Rsp5p-dependent ubiquitination, sorting of cargo proteins at the multivesicular body [Blyttiomyces sp. JEL0837]
MQQQSHGIMIRFLIALIFIVTVINAKPIANENANINLNDDSKIGDIILGPGSVESAESADIIPVHDDQPQHVRSAANVVRLGRRVALPDNNNAKRTTNDNTDISDDSKIGDIILGPGSVESAESADIIQVHDDQSQRRSGANVVRLGRRIAVPDTNEHTDISDDSKIGDIILGPGSVESAESADIIPVHDDQSQRRSGANVVRVGRRVAVPDNNAKRTTNDNTDISDDGNIGEIILGPGSAESAESADIIQVHDDQSQRRSGGNVLRVGRRVAVPDSNANENTNISNDDNIGEIILGPGSVASAESADLIAVHDYVPQHIRSAGNLVGRFGRRIAVQDDKETTRSNYQAHLGPSSIILIVASAVVVVSLLVIALLYKIGQDAAAYRASKESANNPSSTKSTLPSPTKQKYPTTSSKSPVKTISQSQRAAMMMVSTSRGYEDAIRFQIVNPPSARTKPSDQVIEEIETLGPLEAWQFVPSGDLLAGLQAIGTEIVESTDELGQEVVFRERTGEDQCLYSRLPMVTLAGRPWCYFEVAIKEKSPSTVISVGVTTTPYPVFRHVGWHPYSLGYHSDGKAYQDDMKTGRNFGPTFKKGDVVGCGYDCKRGAVFMTLNGNLLGDANFGCLLHEYHMAIAANGPCTLFINVGAETPFKYIPANQGLAF